jgi:hypothetical protein
VRPPIEHAFTIQGDAYVLTECGRGGQERYRREFALAIAAAPDILNNLDGINLFAQAVARQCLRQASDAFWRPDVTPAVRKTAIAEGELWRLVSFEAVPLDVWEEFRQGVDAFIARLPQPLPDVPEPAPAPVPREPVGVAAPEDVPAAVFRGHAQ